MRSTGAPHRWAPPRLAVAHAAGSGSGHADRERWEGRREDGGGGRGEGRAAGGRRQGAWKGPTKRRQRRQRPRTPQRRCQTQGPDQWMGARRGPRRRVCVILLGVRDIGGRPACLLWLGTAGGGAGRPRGGTSVAGRPVSVPPGQPVTLLDASERVARREGGGGLRGQAAGYSRAADSVPPRHLEGWHDYLMTPCW